MTSDLQFAIAGVSIGAVYALIALGYMTIFRASKILNLAQGEFVMAGALMTHFLMESCGMSYWASGLLAVFGVVLIGAGLQTIVLHPIQRAGILIMMMASLGASIVISNAPIPLSFAPGLAYFRDPFVLPPITKAVEAVNVVGVRVPIQRFWAIAIALALFGILFCFSKYSRTGKAMESSATDPLAAQLAGIRIERMVLWSFVISAAIGAVGGIIATPISNMRYDSGGMLGLKGFVAGVLGGWGKESGAVLGGFVLGVLESLCVGLIPVYGSRYQQMWAFAVLIGFLYFRPKGILGSDTVE